jgi:hypothetical protein
LFQPFDYLVVEAEDPSQLLLVGGNAEGVLEEGQLVQVIPFARQFGDKAQLLGADPPQDPPRGDRLAGIFREGQIADLCLMLHPKVLRLAHAETYRA